MVKTITNVRSLETLSSKIKQTFLKNVKKSKNMKASLTLIKYQLVNIRYQKKQISDTLQIWITEICYGW